ncbi:MAG: T9SS type A sorting domain-containing protein [Chitinophagaceae bacterium]|nr:T9SS type A sorting domain-containing protein [Chitinophagaceae bacterium]
MKNFLFLALITLMAMPTRAQNFDFIQPTTKHYFRNAESYIRGIRIDSVRTYPDSIVYHPFRTVRRTLLSSPAYDTAGGCWLGKKITRLTDGTHYFETFQGNKLILKSQANVGDSWVCYEDTSRIFYKAYLSSRSTREIYGVTDSVKVYTFTAFDRDSGFIPYDPANFSSITVSKNFGFYEVFDVYLFPQRHFISGSYYDYFYVKTSSKQFRLVPLPTVTNYELYNYHIGDVFCRGQECVSSWEGDIRTTDTVVTKDTSVPGTIVYDFRGNSDYYCGSPPTGHSYYVSSRTVVVTAGIFQFLDTVLMPEEKGIRTIYYYDPDDSSLCFKSPIYWRRMGGSPELPALCEWGDRYKIGMGQIGETRCVSRYGDLYERGYGTMWVKKVGTPCEATVNVADIAGPGQPHGIQVSPNPATETVTFTSIASGDYTLSLTDCVGRVIRNEKCAYNTVTINCGDFPSGLYFVHIIDSKGQRYTEKLQVNR